MVIVKDPIKEFIPFGETRLIILGTMASRIARNIDNRAPPSPFYYHSPRNHFWKVLNLALSSGDHPLISNEEKKEFLAKHGIAMANIVDEIKTDLSDSQNPSDIVLFQAFKANKLKFKKISAEFKKLLITIPVFFTCSEKPEIQTLLKGFYASNQIDDSFRHKIIFLKSPTRCNPELRSKEWEHSLRSGIK